MEYSIARDDFQAALYLMQGVLERRTPVPILSNVMITTEANGVVITATDQQIGVRQLCTGRVKRKGAATANGRILYDIVRQLPPGEITVRRLDNQWVELMSEKSRFKVVGMDPQEFPAMPKMSREGEKHAYTLKASLLREMINLTLFAVSTDETRVNLSGVFVEPLKEKQLRMVATDGHRLAMITRPLDTVPGGGTTVILPRKGLVEVKRLLDGGDDDDVVSMVTKGNVAHVARGAVEISMRLLEGEFPDYKQVLPGAASRKVTADIEVLEAALRRVSLVSSEISHGIRVAVEPGKLKISSVNPDRGEAEEEIDAEFAGEAIEVGFNARYLLDVLGVLPAGSRVEISLSDELSPGLLQVQDDPDYTYVVMPMRL